MLKTTPFLLLVLLTSACIGQQSTKKMENKQNNPLLCDPEKGYCEIPDQENKSTELAKNEDHKPIKIIYFTDPICSSCWGIEPQLRKLKMAYGEYLQVEYKMGGLLPDWSYNSGGISKPSDVAHHWDEVSQYYQMPIDGDVWLENPLHSSYPPSIAFKAAQLQDISKALRFLRRIREMVFLEKKNICEWQHLAQAAQECGLDTARLQKDVQGQGKTHFESDLALARSMGVRGFPTLVFVSKDGKQSSLYGFKPYALFEKSVQDLYAEAKAKDYAKDWESLFAQYPSYTLREFAEISGNSIQEAAKTLHVLEKQGKLRRFSTKNGDIWKRN